MKSDGSASASDRGLQPERTALAWSRTSLAVVANGVLLSIRDFPHYGRPIPMIEAGVVAIVAVIVYLIGIRRQRMLSRCPLPDRITARREIHLVGSLVLALIVVIAVGVVA